MSSRLALCHRITGSQLWRNYWFGVCSKVNLIRTTRVRKIPVVRTLSTIPIDIFLISRHKANQWFFWPRGASSSVIESSFHVKIQVLMLFTRNGFFTLGALHPLPLPDHHSTQTSRLRCCLQEMFFDPADIQASKQFIVARLSCPRKRIIRANVKDFCFSF